MFRTAGPCCIFLFLSVSAGAATGPGARALFDSCYEQFLELDPVMASYNGDHRYYHRLTIENAARRRKLQALYGRCLDGAARLNREALSATERLYLDAFVFLLERDREALNQDLHLLPLQPGWGLPVRLARMASGEDIHPFRTVTDYEAFISRLHAFDDWVDATITNLKAGAERGVVHPKVVVRMALRELAPLVAIEDPEGTQFWGAVERLPQSLEEKERERLRGEYRDALTGTTLPAYRRFHAYLEDHYLDHAHGGLGLAELPNGEALYRYLIRFYTGLDLPPAKIFALGLHEIDRITGEMDRLRELLGIKLDLWRFRQAITLDARNYFGSQAETFAAFRELGETVSQRLHRVVGLEYHAPYEIRPVESFRQSTSAGAFYEPPSPDGTKPGVFYINYRSSKYPKAFMTTLFLHEAVPGHHLQHAVMRENDGLPRFLRFAYNGAYVEGWGLYSESLGVEMDLYGDPLQYYGHLVYELGRASRLVADVGIHHLGWSRRQAEQYLGERHLDWALNELNRYAAMPAQALSYKIGERMLLILRHDASRALGDDFDLREFHEIILNTGPLPLPILERKVNEWIDAR